MMVRDEALEEALKKRKEEREKHTVKRKRERDGTISVVPERCEYD